MKLQLRYRGALPHSKHSNQDITLKSCHERYCWAYRITIKRLCNIIANASSVYQGVDLWNYKDDNDDNDNDDVDDSAIPSKNPITGEFLRELYTSQLVPDTYIGPVTVKRTKGRGFCLVSTSKIATGQVALISQPLSSLHGDSVNPPQLSDLVMHIRNSSFSPHQIQIFDQLYSGQARPRTQDLPDIDLMDPSSTPINLRNLTPLPHPPDHLMNLVRHNAFGDAHPDLILSRLRGDPLQNVLGIWGEAAMANHSCVPNAVHFTIGDRLLVRATRPILYGEEISLNYLGRGVMMPLGARREELAASYGFLCRCERCRFESQHSAIFNDTLEDVAGLVEDLRPSVIEALQQDDTQQLTRLSATLKEVAEKLEDARREAGIGLQPALWLMAGAYDLYQLLSLVCERLQPSAYKTLCRMSDCVDAAGCTAPGSDLHVLTACKFVRRVQGVYQSTEDPRVLSAQTVGFSALKARYGPLDAATLKLLLDSGADIAAELDRVALPGA